MEEPVLDAEGRCIKGGMLKSQLRVWRLSNFIKMFLGGYGAGKTILGCKRAISLALTNAGIDIGCAICSPTFTVARNTTIVTINELLDGKRRLLGSEEFDFTYHKTEHAWTIRHDSRVGRLLQLTGENPERLKGPNVGAVVIDEPFIQERQVFIELNARVRDPRARRREIFGTGTPEQLNWGHDLCTGGSEDDALRNLDVGLVVASTRENFTLPKDYVTRLESVFTAKAAQAYIDGKFINLSTGTVYYAFDPDECVVSLPRESGVELGVGMDFNVNPMAAVVFWRSGNHVHIFDELELPNADTEYMCQELHSRGYFNAGLRDIYPDPSGKQRHTNAPGGKSDFHYIQAAGFAVNAPDASQPRRDRYNAVNGKFKPKDGKVSLTIEPTCRKLRKYLASYSHEQMKKQESMSHLLDALGYAIHFLYPIDSDTARALRLKGY